MPKTNPQFPVALNSNKLQEADIREMPSWFKTPLDFINKVAETVFYAQEVPILEIFRDLDRTLKALLAYLEGSGESPSSVSVPVGFIIPGGNSAPPSSGYLLCDGSAVSRTTYADLFTAIGTTFGAGDGSTTFNIPDLVGAVPRGAGTSTGYTQNVTVALGAKDDDMLQGHFTENRWGNFSGAGLFTNTTYRPQTDSAGADFNASSFNSINTTINGNPISDGVNGTPRTGNETKMKNVGVNYFIKF